MASFYTDGRTVFNSGKKNKLTIEEELAGVVEKETQFTRGMKHFGVNILIATSPQAKGRIERLWGTLQDRLAQEFRLHGIRTIEEANLYLPKFMKQYNRKFAVLPVKEVQAYFPKVDKKELQFHLAVHSVRKLDNGLCFRFKGLTYQLPFHHQNKRITASRKDTVIVANSNKINIQVLHRGLILKPLLVTKPTPAKIIQQMNTEAKFPNQDAHKPSKSHPWRIAPPMVRSKKNLDFYHQHFLKTAGEIEQTP